MERSFNISNKTYVYCPSINIQLSGTGDNLNNDYYPEVTLTSSCGSISGTTSTLTTPAISSSVIEAYHENYIEYEKGYSKTRYTCTIPTYDIRTATTDTNEYTYYDSSAISHINLNEYTYSESSATNGTETNNFYNEPSQLIMDNYRNICEKPFYYKKTLEDTKRHEKRQQIRKNLIVNIKSRANPINDIPNNEQVAIETLREEITETEFRKYIKYGFVLVKGQSGKTYQIYRNRSHTKVWKNGKVIEEVCVRIKDYNIPPTDNVIAFLNMIQIDEEEFRKIGNIYNMRNAA